MSHKSRNARMILAALGLLLLIAAPFSAKNPVFDLSQQYSAKIATSAVTLYASLRLINSVLSVAMETEVSGGAVLVSGTVQPLKMLEPVDDTVERVADVVFVLALIAGVMTLALAPIGGLGLALLGAALIGGAAMPGRVAPWVEGLIARIRSTGLALGLAVPLGLIAGFAGGEWLTQNAVSNANQVITGLTDTLDEEAASVQTEQSQTLTTFGALQETLFGKSEPSATGTLSIAQSTKRYLDIAGTVMTKADDLFVSFAQLLAAYLFQMIVLPLVLIGVLWRMIGARS
ncbi:MAG: hypothetical protein WA921_10030 [Ahrensia sp.]